MGPADRIVVFTDKGDAVKRAAQVGAHKRRMGDIQRVDQAIAINHEKAQLKKGLVRFVQVRGSEA